MKIDIKALPRRIREFIALMGEDLAFALFSSCGGYTYYIPSQPSDKHDIVNEAGIEAAKLLAAKWPLQYIEIPKADKLTRQYRDAQVIIDMNEKMPRKLLVKKYNLTARRLNQLKAEFIEQGKVKIDKPQNSFDF